MPTNEFTFTFTLNGLLIAILVIVAIVALVFLISVLMKLSKTLGSVSEIVSKNQEELDKTIKTLPEITSKLNSSIDNVDMILAQSSPDIVESIGQVRDTLVNATRLSSDVADSVEYIATTAIDTVDSVSSGFSKSASQMGYVKEIVDVIRNVIRK